jgi:hypothetical protein
MSGWMIWRKRMNVREELINEVAGDNHRVQYDGLDGARIEASAQTMTEAVVMLLEALGAYSDIIKAPADENTADLTKEARYNVLASWGVAQAGISKVAWMLRIDGDEVYRRVVTAGVKNEEPELADL